MAVKNKPNLILIIVLYLSIAISAFHDHHHHNHNHHHHREPVRSPPQNHDHDHDHHKNEQNHNRNHNRRSGNNVKVRLPHVLFELGFLDLAAAASSLSSSSAADWPAVPSTVFAPSDASLQSTCHGAIGASLSSYSCSPSELLHEHVVPGVFTAERLRNLPIGSKIETLSPGHCVTVTRRDVAGNLTASPEMFVGGTEISHPDLYNDGVIVVHGLRGFISPLSPFSCHDDGATENNQDPANQQSLRFIPMSPSYSASAAIMRLMLKDAILRLRATGYSVLSLAIRIKYPELVTLDSVTIFAISDASIFAGLHSYVGNIRFHIVPNAYLTMADLEKLPLGTIVPTLSEGQSLVVTAAGFGGLSAAPMRINYVRIRIPEVMRNFRIVVHTLFLPFPHIRSVVEDDKTTRVVHEVACRPEFGGRVCASDHQDQDQDQDRVPVPPLEKSTAEIEDHGLGL